MSASRSRRRSRKPRRRAVTKPRAVPSDRRERRVAENAAQRRQSTVASRRLGTAGERPPGPFAGLPVSEAAIGFGLIGVLAGYFTAKPLAMAVGAVVCGLGVLEVTIREHLSGYRSHCTLLAAVPAVGVETGIAFGLGVPGDRLLLIVPVVPVFALCFWYLRRSFEAARHARVTRPPVP